MSFHKRSMTGIVSKRLPLPLSNGGVMASSVSNSCLTLGSGSFSIISRRNSQSDIRESAWTTSTKASRADTRTSVNKLSMIKYTKALAFPESTFTMKLSVLCIAFKQVRLARQLSALLKFTNGAQTPDSHCKLVGGQKFFQVQRAGDFFQNLVCFFRHRFWRQRSPTRFIGKMKKTFVLVVLLILTLTGRLLPQRGRRCCLKLQ